MDLNVPINFQGNYHQVEISEGALLQIGQGVTMRSFTSLEVNEGVKLSIGDRVFFNDHCSIRCGKEIEIGKDTMFGDGVRIFDSNHRYSNYHVEKLRFNCEKITIGNNCWIGSNVVILKGVSIGDNVIIGANALIYRDIPADSIVTSEQNLRITPRKNYYYHAFTLTASDTLEELEFLVTELSDVAFHIVAKTNISPYLEKFNQFDNVNLYTNIHHNDIIEDLLTRSDIYLDINHWEEVDGIVGRAIEKGKKIFAFSNVVHRINDDIQVFKIEEKNKMVEAIRQQLEKDDNGD
ncbi:TPA: DapH/DapD/GlmU-related protein [Streptococcus pneumoniae]